MQLKATTMSFFRQGEASLGSAVTRPLVFLWLSLMCLPLPATDPINTNWRGLAIKGYDPVAYFTLGRPAEGKAEFSYTWKGATWRFADGEHLAKFKADPEKYAPQYGGYCAWAVANGDTANIDPMAWRIVDGKLYLNYSPKIQKEWEKDIPGNIAKADAHWPGLL